jgi:diguanylate cyclase (GGDEF)-like protein
MKTRLSQLAASDATARSRLRNSPADRDMLIELMHTSCLLELSKLGSAGMDLATFAQTVVDVLTQFFVIDGCELLLRPVGLPSAHAVAGRLVGANVTAYSLVTSDGESGLLTVSCQPTLVGESDFFRVAADQVVAGLETIAHTERLRRQAATATAMRLAASLEELGIEETFEALVDAFAALANATGASLVLQHPVVGAPLTLGAGVPATIATEHHVDLGSGSLDVSVWWAAEPDHGQLQVLDEVLASLRLSMARCDESRRLREEVEVDPLTGVGNRRRGTRVLASLLARAERHGESVSVLALDIDHFKYINDGKGHASGDAVLQAFASMLVHHVRGYDTVVRTGGEEFLVICPTIDSVGARALAERLRVATPPCCAPFVSGMAPPTVSIGVAVFPEAADYADGLVRKADGALYEAKRAGRNQVVMAVATQAGEATW